MLETETQVATAAVSRRIAALKDQLEELQATLAPREATLERLATDARDWISSRAASLPLPFLASPAKRAPLSVPGGPLAVAAAAVVVGVGVGCVLYALTSGCRSHPAPTSSKGGVRRPSTKISD
ncbi:hypothetical protein V5F59_14540 [Xanthobacter autotrophicus DSM 431]|uniref:hypothetical protein n=1 Tax=Xanthobacter nonsaccharivorans TaxID=3119912 RepID=UPI00372C0CB5